MDKNTFLAIILSVVVISVGFVVQTTFFVPDEALVEASAEEVVSEIADVQESASTVSIAETADIDAVEFEMGDEDYISRTIEAETDKFLITFNTEGAVITSLKLKEHLDGEEPVDMILRENTNLGSFGLSFGENTSSYMTEAYDYQHVSNSDEYSFIRNYKVKLSDGSYSAPFQIKKTYIFFPDEYMFEIRVAIVNSENSAVPLNYSGAAYTLSTGPQIGPEFVKLDGRNEYRKYFSLSGDKRSTIKIKDGFAESSEQMKWSAVVNKYFALIGIPGSDISKVIWSNDPTEGLKETSKMSYVRSSTKGSRIEDVYRFYAGPKLNNELGKYNLGMDNPFGFSDMYLDKAVDSSSWLGWLEFILKFFMETFYKLIPNYGVAIILLTILIKAIFFPITHKSYESTGKMQSIQPKIKELQEKYKSDPNKLNKEMAALYKTEGVNPMGGCLPLVIQMPIFFALYGLLNKYFDLRGAVFIPGWITDLSAPESILNFGNFTLPILGWNDLRLLPILYLGTQLLMSKFTQAPSSGGQSAMQTKMLTLGMPIMFFFILYDMPSGLLIYWTFSNLLTAAQQGYISSKKKKQAS
ncbi:MULTISPECIES: membrane protein insertase YidC [unclassified Oceanispirochaeta]|uniref:membrane protein insertase YidC n=1 Tax=unclassified Oceanispirochaeta TaxID=2635722 RepID=UPI000E097336|nr:MULTISPECIES: membrane protein insertase YidC [unclassified Oceanispirochaeta]MBF9015241.1 membrane protein insertase YidC [Oceanispirochaeta sp. M2]NPD71699.1 membrane protein insertase YidC [Oceanispirochaeta sp. M1]RDG32893.1 membrane protein insertase YidC [Oceanispirochaeta sp. M1]